MNECSALTRQLAWDALPCDKVEQVLADVGMTPSGPDVADAEHAASHSRLSLARPLSALIDHTYAPQLAELIISASASEVEIESDVREAMVHQYGALIATTTTTVIAHLLNDRVLAYNTTFGA